jgi:hypothetical protein
VVPASVGGIGAARARLNATGRYGRFEVENDREDRYWHVSPSVNRASIERHGLDWRRMAATGGIANDPEMETLTPEAECVWLCVSLDDAHWFRELTSHPAVDVWEVDVSGLPVDYPDDSWPFVRVPIAPERVRLVSGHRS